MSFLGRAIAGIATLAPAPSDDFWYGPTGKSSTSGVNVTNETALTYSAVWCATRILSEGVAGLPALLYRRLASGGKERATDQLLYGILHDEPNDETDAFQFFDQMTAWLVNWGNARAEIQRNQAGLPVALWPIHPSRVRVKDRRYTPGRIVYLIRNNDGTETEIDSADMLDVCGPLSDDGLTGKGVITQAREAIGMGMATERFGASFFGNSAVPSGVLTHPGRLKPEAAQNLRASWNRMYSGPVNANKTAILEEGVTYAKIGIDPEQAQFLESRQFNVTEIARWYRIPPHMLADLTRATFSNIEEQGIDFVVHSLRPWLIRWEKAITRKLLMPDMRQTFFVEFLVDALTRGDIAKRTSALQIMFMNGAICQDEWRAIENRNPLPDGLGQQFYRPQNLAPVEAKADEPLPTDNGTTPAETEPVADQQDAAAKADVQATALNGAQIASLIQVSQMTVEGTFNHQAATGMIAAAFPLLTSEQISAIVDNLEKKEPAPDANPNQAPPQASGEDEAPPGTETEDPAGEGQPNQNGLTALAGLMADVTQRMLRIEAVKAKEAAGKRGNFLAWLDAFYEHHEKRVSSAFYPVANAISLSIDAVHDPLATSEKLTENATKRHCERSKAELLEVAGNATAAKLEAAVQAWADGLSSRWQVDVFEAQLADGQIGVGE